MEDTLAEYRDNFRKEKAVEPVQSWRKPPLQREGLSAMALEGLFHCGEHLRGFERG